MTLMLGDCLQKLKELQICSIDAVVTDPPYGLSFMGKKWDYDVPSVEIWKEVFRVLKPGGHVLSFGGTRTYHRMVVNIEDAGFEIRDQVQWIYGSGFPKSTNVALRIDKESGAIGNRGKGFNAAGQGISLNQNKELRSDHPNYRPPDLKTESAKQWQGFGTALKPANEPICLARKPLDKGLTVAENVLKWGVGAINVDGCRIGFSENETDKRIGTDAKWNGKRDASKHTVSLPAIDNMLMYKQGRWPANVLLDEQAAEMLDEQTGELGKSTGENSTNIGGFVTANSDKKKIGKPCGFGDSGGASRFFYVAKASKRERNAGLEGMPERQASGLPMRSKDGERGGLGLDDTHTDRLTKNQNHHPTVKPIKLMEYLIKLITPSSGIVLDPFMGSGSTGVAAKNLGFNFVGIEMNEEYFEIAKKRIDGSANS